DQRRLDRRLVIQRSLLRHAVAGAKSRWLRDLDLFDRCEWRWLWRRARGAAATAAPLHNEAQQRCGSHNMLPTHLALPRTATATAAASLSRLYMSARARVAVTQAGMKIVAGCSRNSFSAWIIAAAS